MNGVAEQSVGDTLEEQSTDQHLTPRFILMPVTAGQCHLACNKWGKGRMDERRGSCALMARIRIVMVVTVIGLKGCLLKQSGEMGRKFKFRPDTEGHFKVCSTHPLTQKLSILITVRWIPGNR
ncbi:hypothetical protein L486_06071 [Kwoniella mangroviensis CBS 10435]|uniref:Uncharacterized protein n=1 Tax=Kwoniella mangroviensis CBS 10435 TaxID=1331196 RepID=A0A1B9IL73_9TREE|nr:hypothetical protein L486_06071 [Kwoniella mangroviensis CBS 10435]